MGFGWQPAWVEAGARPALSSVEACTILSWPPPAVYAGQSVVPLGQHALASFSTSESCNLVQLPCNCIQHCHCIQAKSLVSVHGDAR